MPQSLDERRAYAALNMISFGEHSRGTTLQRVAALAKEALPDHPEVSLTLLKADQPCTAAFTSDLAVQLDERQYQRGFGPCLDAAVSGATIELVLADPDNAYPDFCCLARARGVTHTLSLGLPVAADTVGALNLYSSLGRPFSSETTRIAGTFAGIAGMVLGNADRYYDAVALATQLQEALRSRSVIEQAKGILMQRHHCSADEAFKLLARVSQTQNIKLRIVAETIVNTTLDPRRSPPDAPDGHV